MENKEGDSSKNFDNVQNNESKDDSSFTLTIKKDNLWKYGTFLFLAIAIIEAFFLFSGGANVAGNVVAPSPSPSPTVPNTVNVEVDIEGSPFKGAEDAPVVVVEYSDYECPFCNRAFTNLVQAIEEDYIETGKVKLVYKDFPLDTNCNAQLSRQLHPNACKAAEAARCVRDQLGDEGYFEMHDILFLNYQTLNDANFKSWARDLGVNGDEFDSCLDSGKFTEDVVKDLQEGASIGVQGTPTFVINGQLMRGLVPIDTFRAAIDAEL